MIVCICLCLSEQEQIEPPYRCDATVMGRKCLFSADTMNSLYIYSAFSCEASNKLCSIIRALCEFIHGARHVCVCAVAALAVVERTNRFPACEPVLCSVWRNRIAKTLDHATKHVIHSHRNENSHL